MTRGAGDEQGRDSKAQPFQRSTQAEEEGSTVCWQGKVSFQQEQKLRGWKRRCGTVPWTSAVSGTSIKWTVAALKLMMNISQRGLERRPLLSPDTVKEECPGMGEWLITLGGKGSFPSSF